MASPVSTTALASASLETAYPGSSRSCLPALDHSKGRLLNRALSNGRGVHPRQSNPALMHVSSRGGQLPGSAIRRSSRPFILVQSYGSSRTSAQSSTNQRLRKLASGRVHFHRRLSSSPSLDGFKTIEKGIQGRGIFIQELGFVRARERSHD